MPHYDYQCTCCGHEFELLVSMNDRDKACEEPCPECGWGEPGAPAVERVWVGQAPGVGYHAESLRKRTPEAFKDLLRNMKKKHRHSTIDV